MVLINWINENTGLLNLLFAFLVAISTVIYALLTRKLVQETVKLRKAETDPDIAIYLEVRGRRNLDLIIRNVGSGPAYNVSFSIEASNTPDQKFENSTLFQGIRYVAPNQGFRLLYGLIATQRVIADPYTITVEYQTKDQTQIRETFVLNPDLYENVYAIEDTALQEITQAIEKLGKNFDRNRL